jgi:hypothetical protein
MYRLTRTQTIRHPERMLLLCLQLFSLAFSCSQAILRSAWYRCVTLVFDICHTFNCDSTVCTSRTSLQSSIQSPSCNKTLGWKVIHLLYWLIPSFSCFVAGSQAPLLLIRLRASASLSLFRDRVIVAAYVGMVCIAVVLLTLIGIANLWFMTLTSLESFDWLRTLISLCFCVMAPLSKKTLCVTS